MNLFLTILLNDFETDSIENMSLSTDEKDREKLELERIGVKQKMKNKLARKILKRISGRLAALLSGKKFDADGNPIEQFD